MGFLKRLFGAATPPPARALSLYIRCKRCGAPVHVRIDTSNDLSGAEEGDGYFVGKEVMDDRCFRLMRAELEFDESRRETARRIEGGEFITATEYEALMESKVEGQKSKVSE